MVRFMMFVFIKLKSIRIEFPESIGAAEMHKSKRNFDDEWRMAWLDATHQRFSFTLECLNRAARHYVGMGCCSRAKQTTIRP